MQYQGKNVWVIGASSGIGAALATTLALQGARVAISARRQAELDTLAASIGPRAMVVACDVTDAAAVQDAARQVQEDFGGRIDHVVLMFGSYTPTSLQDMDVTTAQQIINVNLGGMINALYAILPLLRMQGQGQVAICGSVAGYRGLPYAQPYGATKAALINLAETAAIEEARHGVDIRLISPGFVRTPMTDKNSFTMPMMIEPEEAAAAIADGLRGRSFDIHFPKKFTYLMKALTFLPNFIYLRMMRR